MSQRVLVLHSPQIGQIRVLQTAATAIPEQNSEELVDSRGDSRVSNDKLVMATALNHTFVIGAPQGSPWCGPPEAGGGTGSAGSGQNTRDK